MNGAGACLDELTGAAAALEGRARLQAANTYGLNGAPAAGGAHPAGGLPLQVRVLACTAVVNGMHVHVLVLVAAFMGVCSTAVECRR